MTSDKEDLKKKQQNKWIELFQKEKEEKNKCESESISEKCSNCDCWKMRRYIYDEYFYYINNEPIKNIYVNNVKYLDNIKNNDIWPVLFTFDWIS